MPQSGDTRDHGKGFRHLCGQPRAKKFGDQQEKRAFRKIRLEGVGIS